MKKIGILTFHRAHNYGAVLQAYALQEYLRGLGFDVTIVNYTPSYLIDPYRVIPFKGRFFRSKTCLQKMKFILYSILTIYTRYFRFKAFEKSILKLLKLSNSEFSTAEQIQGSFDVIILGSDQIWNDKITNGFDSVYFGQIPNISSSKIISYAASMEAHMLTDSQKSVLKESLAKIDFISVREMQLKDLLRSFISKQISVVLDPTLLCDSSVFNKIAVKPNIKRKYVLVYQVAYLHETLNYAKRVASRLDATVIQISAAPLISLDQNIKQAESVEEFLGWFKHAECIVTTSFHGTAFSLIFKKNFYSIGIKGIDTRISSLLKQINLSDRIVDPNRLIDNISLIQYDNVTSDICSLRDDSREYLLNSINNDN